MQKIVPFLWYSKEAEAAAHELVASGGEYAEAARRELAISARGTP